MKNKKLNWKNFFLNILWFPSLVFSLNEIVIYFLEEINRSYHIDIPMHMLGGVSIAYSTLYTLKEAEKWKLIKIKSMAIKIFLLTSTIFMAATIWEFYEFVHDQIFGTEFQMNIDDTIKDMAFGVLGGFVFLYSKEKMAEKGKK